MLEYYLQIAIESYDQDLIRKSPQCTYDGKPIPFEISFRDTYKLDDIRLGLNKIGYTLLEYRIESKYRPSLSYYDEVDVTYILTIRRNAWYSKEEIRELL